MSLRLHTVRSSEGLTQRATLDYSATIFSYAGFDNPTAVGLIVAGTNFIFTGVAMLILDRVGKRRILIFSIPGMVIGTSSLFVLRTHSSLLTSL